MLIDKAVFLLKCTHKVTDASHWLLPAWDNKPLSVAVHKICVCDRAKETHQIAEASQARNDLLRAAFGLSEFYKEGTSLDPQRKAKEQAAEALAAVQKKYA